MLVLARGVGQSVVLDGRITITVLASRGGLVRIGIDAPAEVGVRRGELAPLTHLARAGVDPQARAEASAGRPGHPGGDR
jgi:carbon storage regulator